MDKYVTLKNLKRFFDNWKSSSNSDVNINNVDINNVVVKFENGDTDNSTNFTEVGCLNDHETIGNFFTKTSLMFKNIRYIIKLLGTTDLSNIGDGTITGSIVELNNSIEDLYNRAVFHNNNTES